MSLLDKFLNLEFHEKIVSVFVIALISGVGYAVGSQITAGFKINFGQNDKAREGR